VANGAVADHAQFRGAYRAVAAAAAPPAPSESPDARGDDGKGPLRRARAAFEADFIAKVLQEHQGNVSRAAVALGLSRASLQKKMKEYALR
jgi:transcriptional regulator with PAS, ATPase and Fis domain